MKIAETREISNHFLRKGSETGEIKRGFIFSFYLISFFFSSPQLSNARYRISITREKVGKIAGISYSLPRVCFDNFLHLRDARIKKKKKKKRITWRKSWLYGSTNCWIEMIEIKMPTFLPPPFFLSFFLVSTS